MFKTLTGKRKRKRKEPLYYAVLFYIKPILIIHHLFCIFKGEQRTVCLCVGNTNQGTFHAVGQHTHMQQETGEEK